MSAEVEEVKRVMMDNIDKMIDRGEALESLVGNKIYPIDSLDRSAELQATSVQFYKAASRLKRTMWWKVHTNLDDK